MYANIPYMDAMGNAIIAGVACCWSTLQSMTVEHMFAWGSLCVCRWHLLETIFYKNITVCVCVSWMLSGTLQFEKNGLKNQSKKLSCGFQLAKAKTDSVCRPHENQLISRINFTNSLNILLHGRTKTKHTPFLDSTIAVRLLTTHQTLAQPNSGDVRSHWWHG